MTEKNTFNKVIAMLISLLLVFMAMPFSDNAFSADKTYPYGIQVGVFKSEAGANQFLKTHRNQLTKGLILKNNAYHVLYGVYDTESSAKKDLPKARKVDANAYVFRLNPSNEKTATQWMNAKLAPKVVTAKPVVQTKAKAADTLVPPKSAAAPTPATVPQPSKDLKIHNVLLQDDLVINGVFGVASISFNISKEWKMAQGAYLEIYLSHENQKVFPESSATLLLNDVPIKSYYLIDHKTLPAKMTIPLSPELMKTGFNELKLKTYMRTSEDLCENEGNPANWIVVHKKSYVHLPYYEKVDAIDLTEFPYPYIRSGPDSKVNFSFIYDEKAPNTEILRGIFTVASNLGRQFPFDNLNYHFSPLQQNQQDQSYIYVGTEVPQTLRDWLPKTYKMPTDSAFISEVPLQNNRRLLLIISKDATTLSALANLLTYEAVIKQLETNTASFAVADLASKAEEENDQLLTFGELGYSNVTFEGTKAASAAYFIETPNNWQLINGSKLVVRTRFSALVDAETSTLTATVNGIPIGSHVLDQAYKDGQVFEFILPKEVLTSNRFNIVLSYSLGGEFKCDSLRSNKGIWAFISNSSYVQFVQEPKTHYELQTLPSPFVSDGKFSQFNLALDANTGFDELELAADLMSRLSRQTSQLGEFTVSFGQNSTAANQIIIATASSPLITATNKKTIIPYNDTFSGFKPHPGLYLLSGEQNHYATAQIYFDSEEKHHTLWITSIKPEGFQWVGKYLNDLSLNGQVKDDAIFVSRNGLLQTIAVTHKNDPVTVTGAVNQTEAPRATFENIRNFLIFLGAMLFIITMLIIFNFNRRKK